MALEQIDPMILKQGFWGGIYYHGERISSKTWGGSQCWILSTVMVNQQLLKWRYNHHELGKKNLTYTNMVPGDFSHIKWWWQHCWNSWDPPITEQLVLSLCFFWHLGGTGRDQSQAWHVKMTSHSTLPQRLFKSDMIPRGGREVGQHS